MTVNLTVEDMLQPVGSGMSHAVLDSSMSVDLPAPSLCMQRAVSTGRVHYRGERTKLATVTSLALFLVS